MSPREGFWGVCFVAITTGHLFCFSAVKYKPEGHQFVMEAVSGEENEARYEKEQKETEKKTASSPLRSGNASKELRGWGTSDF